VWSDDNYPTGFSSLSTNEFAARTTGGVRFVTAIDGSGNPTGGVSVVAGGGSWSSLSDRNAKDNFAPVDTSELLRRLSSFPIQTWNYKAQAASIRHIGPTAQDFHAAFSIGEDDKHITTIDADGVALAAIQGLYRMLLGKDTEIRDLRAHEAVLSRRVNEIQLLKARLDSLEGNGGLKTTNAESSLWHKYRP
jgi:hypothetical protein